MSNKTDSVGNLLPEGIRLNAGVTADELSKALTVNTFNLAAAVAMSKGHEVVYDARTKTATIEYADGSIGEISHL